MIEPNPREPEPGAPPPSGEAVGAVWPVAVLLGAGTSATLAAGAWVGAALDGLGRPVGLLRWSAEHAVLGTVWGAAVAAALALASHRWPRLADAGRRRALAGRVVLLLVVAAHSGVAAFVAATQGLSAGPALGLVAGLGAVVAGLRLGLEAPFDLRELPRLDPIRVAAAVALVTLPLTASASLERISLVGAWRAMLGG